jgi:CO/xanthine dehydrogenase Mo-binding subunit/aerobic-type carbon monoxide dehydrogenase small subunit (CoxS/CutS family)
MTVTIRVNRQNYSINDEEKGLNFLKWLREIAGLTGTKCGCGTGHCGSCNVLIDGKAKRACLYKVEKLVGKEIVTIEGLAKDGKLHPVQESFIKCGVMQCGYCTPSQIITVVGLLNENPEPTREDIDKAFRGVLCRCGSYPRVIKAIERSAAIMNGKPWEDYEDGSDMEEIGKSHPMYDAVEKVTGALKFTDDYIFPGMLQGKILFSEHPSANLIDIDASEAEKMPGVKLILTHKNIKDVVIGPLIPDAPLLVKDRIRSMADPLAVVFAETIEQAENAASAIKVSYEVLPGVFSPQEALKDGAPLLHEKGNIIKETRIKKGNVNRALEEADIVISGDYHTSRIEHAYIETECSIAKPNDKGGVDIYTATQSPFHEQEGAAGLLDLDKEKVKCVQVPVGGSFGGKGEILIGSAVSLGAMKTGRPCKIALSREDSLRFHYKRHPFDMKYKIGANKDGKLCGMDIKMLADGGAYTSYSWRVLPQSVSYSTGPYEVPNLDTEGKAVFTNNITTGAMRGYGVPQCTFAVESIMDQLARELNMGPISLRRKNALVDGSVSATGQILSKGQAYVKTLDIIEEKVKAELLPLKEKYKNVGIGIASSWRHIPGGLDPRESANVGLELLPEGRVLLKDACSQMGNESRVSLAQIAAQKLSLPFEKFDFAPIETDKVPWGGAVMSSRGTYLWGHAAADAAERFLVEIIKESSAVLAVPAENLEFRNGNIYRDDNEAALMSLGDLEKKLSNSGKKIDVVGNVLMPRTYYPLEDANESKTIDPKEYKTHHTSSYITVAVALQADKENKKVKLLKAIGAFDIGTVLNPEAARRQAEGGMIMGLGAAVSEEFPVIDGVNQIKTLARYKIPDMVFTPEIEVFFVDNYDHTGPLGAKGVGEIGLLPMGPAVTNAWFDATGERVNRIPLLSNIK